VTWDFALAPLVPNEFNQAKSVIKFLEYAALGVPGIFSHVGEYGSTIEHGETGLLVASDRVQQWEQAIFDLASNPPLRERLATNARRELLNRHLLGDTVPIWLSVIAENAGNNCADRVPRSHARFVSR
jgi:glycosyltransferase involved in cell wall biosynthesis